MTSQMAKIMRKFGAGDQLFNHGAESIRWLHLTPKVKPK